MIRRFLLCLGVLSVQALCADGTDSKFISDSDMQFNGGNGQKRSVIDFDAAPKPKLEKGRTWGFKTRIEADYEADRNPDLDTSVKDSTDTLELSIQSTFQWKPSKTHSLYVSAELYEEIILRDDNVPSDRSEVSLELKRLFWTWKNVLSNTRLIIGRQRLALDREWLIEETLDAFHVSWEKDGLRIHGLVGLEAFIDTDLLNWEGRDSEIVDFLFRVRYDNPEETLRFAPYFCYRHDTSDEYDRPLLVGLHMHGNYNESLYSWLDCGYTYGRELEITTDDEIKTCYSGVGWDLGTTYYFERMWQPSFTVGYAFGNGSKHPGRETTKGFRQSGFHDNTAKVAGKTTVSYYGEAFDPELNNMHIFSVSTGILPRDKWSMELFYHHFRQHHRSTEIFSSGVDADPNGRYHNLGHELDLVIAIKEPKGWAHVFKAAAFFPSAAFDMSATYWFFGFKTKYSF